MSYCTLYTYVKFAILKRLLLFSQVQVLRAHGYVSTKGSSNAEDIEPYI